MSYKPYSRNAKGLVFFGDAGSDGLFESQSTLTFGANDNDLQIPDGKFIGSQTTHNAIQIAAGGNITVSQDLTITGDLIVNGDTTTVNTTNLDVKDSLIVLSSGTSTPANDVGILIDRGSAPNAFMGWDESADKFIVGSGTFSGTDTGNLDIKSVSIVADTFEGKVSADAITGQTEKSSAAASNDLLLLIDSEDSNAIKKITRGNLISGLGGFSNFTVTADSGSNQTIADGNTLDIAGGDGITTAVGATDTVTVTADLKANGGLVFESNEIAVDLAASAITGTLAIGDGGTGATTASAARTALGLAIGSDVQAYDAALAAIAGLATTDGGVIVGNGSTFVLETGATLRTSLGVDAAGTDNSTDVTLAGSLDYLTISGQEITVGAIVLSTDVSGQLPVANGGTGGSSASAARTNLGLAIGSDVQAYHANLAAIAGFTPSDGYFIVGNGSTFVLENGATVRTSLGVDAAGTDNSTDVTLVTSSHDYLSISGQAITLGQIDISDDTNLAVNGTLTLSGDTLSVANGGVDTTQLAASAVETAKINDGAVTEAKRTRTINTSAITSSTTASNDVSIVDSSGGTVTMTLPAASSNSGRIMRVKKTDSSANTVVVDGNGSETIDGAANVTLYHQYETVTCICDGSNWFLI